MCSLCKSAAANKINLCLFFIGLFPCSLSVTTRSLIRALLFSPPGSDSVSSWSAGRLTRSVKSDCNFPRPAFRFCHDQSQRIVSAVIRVSPRRSRPRRLITALRIVSAMIRVSPRRFRPPRFITALRIVSATIGASSCRSIPRNLISRCPLVSGNWASGFISPVSALVEAGRGSNARSVLCLASELHLQQAMTSVDRQE